MRSMFRRAFCALVAVLALGAVAASAASALPEFKPVPTKKQITGTGGSVSLNWYSEGETIECSKSTATGEITGARTIGKLAIIYTGCTSRDKEKSGCSVNSPGAKTGEIVVTTLVGELGTIATKEASSGVGILLKQESKSHEWLEYEKNACLRNFELKIDGDAIAEIPVIGKKQLTNELVLSSGIHKIKLDSGTEETAELELLSFSVAMKGVNELSFEEALEVT
jgi:hypothetical protein